MAGSQRLALLNLKAKNLVWVLVIIQALDTLLVSAINDLWVWLPSWPPGC